MSSDPQPDDKALEEAARPPFLRWNLLYAVVAIALALEISALAVMTVVYR
jgi:hypothetical protein